MRPVILYREGDMDSKELAAANQFFYTTSSRMTIQSGDLVLARYCALPFYKEQEYDINYVGASMINTFAQHNWVADLRNWAEELADVTPQTWYRLEDVPKDGAFVLKGKTNSKKHQWKTSMYAADRNAAIKVYDNLTQDYMIGAQPIYIRRYVPLKTYLIGIQDLPITNEWRHFVLDGQVLTSAYYWSSHVDDLPEAPKQVDQGWVREVAARTKGHVRFCAVDVAETAEEKLIVVDINDGQMSGLSETIADELYQRLKDAL
jgi:hypothetical protein